MNIQKLQEIFGANNIQPTGSRQFGNFGYWSDLDVVVYLPKIMDISSAFSRSVAGCSPDFMSDRDIAFATVAELFSKTYIEQFSGDETNNSYDYYTENGELVFSLNNEFGLAYPDASDSFVFSITIDGDISIHLIVTIDAVEFRTWVYLSGIFKNYVDNVVLNQIEYRTLFNCFRLYITKECIATNRTPEALFGDIERLFDNIASNKRRW